MSPHATKRSYDVGLGAGTEVLLFPLFYAYHNLEILRICKNKKLDVLINTSYNSLQSPEPDQEYPEVRHLDREPPPPQN